MCDLQHFAEKVAGPAYFCKGSTKLYGWLRVLFVGLTEALQISIVGSVRFRRFATSLWSSTVGSCTFSLILERLYATFTVESVRS